jgi:uncharacterized membrane protein/protein-disulfide isomerase
MWNRIGRWIAPALMTLGSLGGLAFAWSSTLDYSRHLDRRVHDLSCGFVPGVAATTGADEGCRAAIYSPYAALMRDRLWGGLPISLFAIGAFSFFAAFAFYLLIAGRGASRKAMGFVAITSIGPFAVSILMGYLSATRLGTFCKTCIGIYASSTVLFLGGVLALFSLGRETSSPPATEAAGNGSGLAARPLGHSALVPGWLLALATFACGPALAYARTVPNQDAQILSCGKLAKPLPATGELALKVPFARVPSGLRTAVTLVVDPLCPSCRALHRRLDAEGFLEQMDTGLLLFPLDSSCNWMVDRDVHPGACEVAKAVICAQPKGQAAQLLEWAYQSQEELMAAAKGKGGKAIVGYIEGSFPGLSPCLSDKQTQKKLEDMLRFAVDNRLPVSTPQIFVGDQRMCEEDTDMGMVYALRRLAPQLKARQF